MKKYLIPACCVLSVFTAVSAAAGMGLSGRAAETEEDQAPAISSVFDYLYAEYAERRREYLKKQERISEYDSENLMYVLIREELEKRKDIALDVVCHQPLQLLFRDQSRMTDEERQFVNTGLSHLDFLIFNKVSKQPILAIEVDGFQHFKDEKQRARDKKKDHSQS